MVRLGVFMLILGVGSLVLPYFHMQFRLMSLVQPAQPVAGIAVAAVGGLCLFLGGGRKKNPE
jgi:hypothetical protein